MAEHELTEHEGQLAADLWLARCKGLAGAVKPELLPAAVALEDRGWAERRWDGDNVVFWFSDEGVGALGVNALTDSVKGREN